MHPSISVVIPAFNCAEYLPETIESILNQTVLVTEIIVVDDGSKEDIESSIKNYDKVVFIRKENGGPASARNLGVKQAKGEFIAFCDGDDVWFKNKIEEQLKCFANLETGFVFAETEKIDPQSKILDYHVTYKRYRGKVVEQLFAQNFVPTSSVMVRKSILDKTTLFREEREFIALEDYDLWLKIATFTEFDFVAKPLVYYRKHPQNISKNYDHSYGAEKKIISMFLEEYKEKYPSLVDSFSKRLSKLHWEWGMAAWTAEDIKTARREFKNAVKHNKTCFSAYAYYFSSLLGMNGINFLRRCKQAFNR